MTFAEKNRGTGPGGEPGQMSWTFESSVSVVRKVLHILEKVYPAPGDKWWFSSVWNSWGCIWNTVWTAHLPVQERHRHGGASWAESHSVTEGLEHVVCEERCDMSFSSVEEKRPSCLPSCHGRDREGSAVFFLEMCDESWWGKGCKLIPRLTDCKSISTSFNCSIKWDI